MASTSDADEVLRSTTGKANFQRIARLLISGGTTLLREIFDVFCPPSNLPTILKKPATKKQLKSAKLTKPQWDCLYPSPGVYGESVDFDVTLLFRLLRTICNLTPPATGWDALPTNTDRSLAADLARIKYYRNSVYGHGNMEIIDDFDFLSLWQEISGALVRIAGQISPVRKCEWQDAIDKFLKEPLTAEDERNVEELLSWYKSDIDVKKSLDELKVITKEGMDQLKGVRGLLEEKIPMIQAIEEKLQGLETAYQEDAQVTKDKLAELHQLIDSLGSTSGSSNLIAGSVHDLCSGKGDDLCTSQQGMTSNYSKGNDDRHSSSSNYSTTDSSQLTTTSYQPSYHKLFTKPFAPRSSSDIPLGMEVLFTRSRGWLSRGKVKYIGSFPGRHETYIGIELGSGQEGKHYGPSHRQSLFTCKPNRAIFIPFNKVVMCYGER
ncbi:E3 ubiquitin-protein ligase DZIP3-like [Montipora capricornis]|uniref:E3 ubiquitin-protein ligase DZIP3-like n=1 Tax=Montipora capricornis TaxID=246305 RepID=UPI0035F1E3DA